MTYTTGSLIAAADFNSFATDVNKVWGLGTGDYGYGCTNTVGSVTAVVDTATATQWTTLLARGNSSAGHQGTTWSSGTSVSTGNTISVISTLTANIASIGSNRLTTAPSGLTSTGQTPATDSASWNATKTFTFTVAFSGGTTTIDSARHFFNAGGKIQVAYAHSGGTGIGKDADWTSLCTACGSTVFAYGTTTKSGGSGTPAYLANGILNTATGYYQLLTTNTTVFKQLSANSPYTSNFVQLDVKTDTVTDGNGRGGKGSTLTFLVTFADAYSDAFVSPTGTWTVTATLVAPNTTFLNNVPTATYTAGSWTNA